MDALWCAFAGVQCVYNVYTGTATVLYTGGERVIHTGPSVRCLARRSVKPGLNSLQCRICIRLASAVVSFPASEFVGAVDDAVYDGDFARSPLLRLHR